MPYFSNLEILLRAKKNKKRNWEISKNIQRAVILQSRVGRSQNFSIQWNLQRNLKKS